MRSQHKQLRIAINEYLQYMDVECNYSPWSVHTYKGNLNQLVKFLKSDPFIYDITTSDIREFVNNLKGYNPNTIRHKVGTLKSFFNWLEDQEYIAYNPTKKIRTPKRHKPAPHFLTEEEMQRVLSTPVARYANKPNMSLHKRDTMIVKLLIFTGIRRSELVALEIEDLMLEEGLLIVKRGKGGKFRYIPLFKDLITDLRRYLKWRDRTHPNCRSPRLFLSFRGTEFNVWSINDCVRRHLRACGIKGNCHALRHSYATFLLRKGANLYDISQLLGHSSLMSTEKYLHTNPEQQKANIESLSMLNSRTASYRN